MSGVVLPTPGQLVVVSRLEDDVLGLILGRERLPRLLFLPGVGGPGLVYPVSPSFFRRLEDLMLDRENVDLLDS